MDNSTIPDATDGGNSSTAGLPEGEGGDANCGGGNEYNGKLGLRVAAIFIILVTSAIGTLFPIITRKLRGSLIPGWVYDFAKYFGSGVIIATAFIHLLAPANEALGSECLTGTWTVYPWAQAIAMASVFLLFVIEVVAFRLGHAKLRKLGNFNYHSHGGGGDDAASDHGHADHPHSIGGARPSSRSATSPETARVDSNAAAGKYAGEGKDQELGADVKTVASQDHLDDLPAQILAAAILEFGVIFHSVVIGLTLAVDPDFVVLFVVIIFHQMFEGLGLGSRLSQLSLPGNMTWMIYVAGLVYSVVTPLGLAIGLGVRTTYNPESPTANKVAGTLDSFSAGVLLYTGLVELIAHDFIFNKFMMQDAGWGRLGFAIGCVLFGAGIMALLGRWA